MISTALASAPGVLQKIVRGSQCDGIFQDLELGRIIILELQMVSFSPLIYSSIPEKTISPQPLMFFHFEKPDPTESVNGLKIPTWTVLLLPSWTSHISDVPLILHVRATLSSGQANFLFLLRLSNEE